MHVLLLASCFWSSCAPERSLRAPPPTRRAALEAPADLLPADLQVAIRVDLTRLTSELGGPLATQLVVETLVDPSDSAASAFLTEAIGSSELSWLGFRIPDGLHAAEKVLILRGRFSGWGKQQAPDGFAWTPPEEGSWPHYAREVSDAGAFERIYPLGDQLVLMSSRAEVAALERSFERAPGEVALRPPDRGVVSGSARAGELSRAYLRSFPTLAEHFSRAELLTGYVEPHAANLDLALEIAFASTEQARAGSDVLDALLSRVGGQPCVVGELARSARISVFDRAVRVRAELAEPLVRALQACVLGGECCA